MNFCKSLCFTAFLSSLPFEIATAQESVGKYESCATMTAAMGFMLHDPANPDGTSVYFAQSLAWMHKAIDSGQYKGSLDELQDKTVNTVGLGTLGLPGDTPEEKTDHLLARVITCQELAKKTSFRVPYPKEE